MQHEIEQLELNNGLKVVLENIPHRKAAAIGITLPVGSRFESPQEMGFSHFTEHLLFKGTQKRNYREISRSLEKLGGYLNASTSRETTVYYAMIAGRHLEVSMDVLSDIFFESQLKTEEFETEKKVILEEIKMAEDDPEELVFDLFYEDAFGDTGLARPIAGTLDSISASHRDNLFDFYRGKYGTRGPVLSIAGNLWSADSAKNSVLQNVKKYFERSENTLGGCPSMKLIEKPAEFFCGKIRHVQKDLEQIHFLLGLPGLNVEENQKPHLNLFNNAFGGSGSSRLFTKLREENGLCYSIGSFHNSYAREGVWIISCACSPEHFLTAVDLCLQQLREVLDKGLEAHEIEESQSGFAGYLELSSESPSSRAESNARALLYLDRLVSLESKIQQIEEVNIHEVIPEMLEYWQNKTPVLTSLGPLPVKSTEKKVRELFKKYGF
ncbi:MAG: insulinase family protein [Leptospiraceae bacterium]|nr:insulinase family protein [Leptospiraceae bacterium]